MRPKPPRTMAGQHWKRNWPTARTSCASSIWPSVPTSSARSASAWAQHNLVTPKSRVVVEKPLGKDGASAEAINDAIGKVFAEPMIYRIDHYLGKETVQNLMALRFANALFEPVWNCGPHRPCADHRGGNLGCRRPCRLLRYGRRAARHGAEPHPAAALPRRHGTAILDGCRCRAR